MILIWWFTSPYRYSYLNFIFDIYRFSFQIPKHLFKKQILRVILKVLLKRKVWKLQFFERNIILN